MLKGLIDPSKEVEKLNKKKAALQQTVEKLKKAMEVKGDEYFLYWNIFKLSHTFRLHVQSSWRCQDSQQGETGYLQSRNWKIKWSHQNIREYLNVILFLLLVKELQLMF